MASKVERRRREIIHILQTENSVYVKELAKLFKVSKETIRSDVDYLVKKYDYQRIHGGIKQGHKNIGEGKYQYQDHKQENIENKKQICFRTIDLIQDGDCIYVDGGTTVAYLLNYINRRHNVTVVTPSIAILMKYMMDGYEKVFKDGGHQLIFVGGSVDSQIMTTYGPFFQHMVEDIHFDSMILSVDSVDRKIGSTNRDEIAYAIVKTVMKQSNKRILLVDETKFTQAKRYQVMDWNELDYLVTQKELDQQWLETLKKEKVIYYKA